MMASILRQIYARLGRGFHTTEDEMKVAKDLLTARGDSAHSLDFVANMFIAVAPSYPGSTEEVQAEKERFVALHLYPSVS